jgi:hypothetical protein
VIVGHVGGVPVEEALALLMGGSFGFLASWRAIAMRKRSPGSPR